MTHLKVFRVMATVGLLLVLANHSLGAFIQLNPRGTYLQTYSDSGATVSSRIALASLGIQPGDWIRIEGQGYMKRNSATPDETREIISVFSSNNTLLSADLQFRVPGAIDAGVDFETLNTYYPYSNGHPTDIPEDFAVASASLNFDHVIVQVPAGAAYLFVAPHDCYYSDNSDPNGDFGIEITEVPEPSTLSLLALPGLLMVRKRRRD